MAETRRTPTETLVSVMEELGESEAKELIVVYTNQNGELCWSCTTDAITVKLGLIEAARTAIKRGWKL